MASIVSEEIWCIQLYFGKFKRIIMGKIGDEKRIARKNNREI